MKYPNLRYGNVEALQYYAQGHSPRDIAKTLRRTERCIQNWLNGKERVPWWAPEILRLQQFEYEMRTRRMGLSAHVIQLRPHLVPPPIAAPTADEETPDLIRRFHVVR
jgi:hypothetical protein